MSCSIISGFIKFGYVKENIFVVNFFILKLDGLKVEFGIYII